MEKEFAVSTLKTGALLRILLIIAIIGQLNFHLLIYLKEYINPEISPFYFLIGILSPIVLLLIWLIRQKYDDTVRISDAGISSTKFGNAGWPEVSFISLETVKGASIYIRIKKKGRFTFSFPNKRKLTREESKVLEHMAETISALKREGVPISIKKQRFFGLIGLYLFCYFAISLIVTMLLY